MRVRLSLFVGALLLASLAMAGAATAVPADGESLPTESITDENESADAGICLVGAGGPCNGDQSDRGDGQPAHGDEQIGSDDGNESDDVGICLVGAGGPCNGDDQSDRGDGQPAHGEERIGSENGSGSDDAGICLVGAGGPCNGDNQSDRNDGQPAHGDEQIGSGDGNESDDAGICLTKIGGPCNGGDQLQYYGDDSTTDSVDGLSALFTFDPFGFFEMFFDPLV